MHITYMFTSHMKRDHRTRERMVVEFTAPYAISAYHHCCCEFESRSGRGVQHYVIMFVSPPVSSSNKTDRHDRTEIWLNVAFNAIKQGNNTHEYNKTMI